MFAVASQSPEKEKRQKTNADIKKKKPVARTVKAEALDFGFLDAPESKKMSPRVASPKIQHVTEQKIERATIAKELVSERARDTLNQIVNTNNLALDNDMTQEQFHALLQAMNIPKNLRGYLEKVYSQREKAPIPHFDKNAISKAVTRMSEHMTANKRVTRQAIEGATLAALKHIYKTEAQEEKRQERRDASMAKKKKEKRNAGMKRFMDEAAVSDDEYNMSDSDNSNEEDHDSDADSNGNLRGFVDDGPIRRSKTPTNEKEKLLKRYKIKASELKSIKEMEKKDTEEALREAQDIINKRLKVKDKGGYELRGMVGASLKEKYAMAMQKALKAFKREGNGDAIRQAYFIMNKVVLTDQAMVEIVDLAEADNVEGIKKVVKEICDDIRLEEESRIEKLRKRQQRRGVINSSSNSSVPKPKSSSSAMKDFVVSDSSSALDTSYGTGDTEASSSSASTSSSASYENNEKKPSSQSGGRRKTRSRSRSPKRTKSPRRSRSKSKSKRTRSRSKSRKRARN